MPAQNLWGISNQPRNVRTGWTASSIAHNEALHKSVQDVLSPTGEQKSAIENLSNRILGVNNFKMGTSVPAGVTTGSAQVLGNGGIPAAVERAIGNLNTNIEARNTSDILNKFMELLGNRQPAVQVNTVTPAMDAYYRNKNTIMSAPRTVQTNINELLTAADKLQPKGVMSITPGIPGAYEGSVTQDIDRALTRAYATQSQALKGAETTGWLPYMPKY